MSNTNERIDQFVGIFRGDGRQTKADELFAVLQPAPLTPQIADPSTYAYSEDHLQRRLRELNENAPDPAQIGIATGALLKLQVENRAVQSGAKQLTDFKSSHAMPAYIDAPLATSLSLPQLPAAGTISVASTPKQNSPKL